MLNLMGTLLLLVPLWSLQSGKYQPATDRGRSCLTPLDSAEVTKVSVGTEPGLVECYLGTWVSDGAAAQAAVGVAVAEIRLR